ncbi:serine hydrolase domain-containing protein [Amycolatopsis sp. DG1A-15b]|uniref:serine hydrolase domain-containing protein n=1 Tax=Amycolatopsis sp. DG1A-15b TaxID=3052846 RepID=UPI00255B4D8D|nr:serine hydrolase domain-containing protein [Amycolatopsis sp. DG1A-15b]WIX89966.1 serine hydrolase domain-containing protein [Amycolatopsis sp. DG1A-15b]
MSSSLVRKGVVVLAVAGLLGATVTTAEAGPPRNGALQEKLDALVGQFPAALASVSRGGRTESLVAGSARLGSRVPVPAGGRVRAGSNTKTFTAVVVLQLVAEGKVVLDAPIERYLPGLVPGGAAITVRQLLQHTSGLPNYTEYLGLDDIAKLRHRYFRPHELLALALAHPAKFAPGTKWEYSNTNYVLAGLLIERVTGRPVAEEITERVIRKASLRNTYWPDAGDRAIRGPHPRGYARSGGEVIDVTELDPSWGWAAGQLISTPGDLAQFSRALLAGRLLPAPQLAEMRKTVEAPVLPGWRYGLGLFSVPLSCGGVYWGHGGDIHGFETRGGATDDGRSVGLAVTALPGTFGDPDQAARAVVAAVDTAFCR